MNMRICPALMTGFRKLLNAPGGLYSSEKNDCLKSITSGRISIVEQKTVKSMRP